MMCPVCMGTGKWPNNRTRCSVCTGDGELPDDRIHNKDCPVCMGTGKWPSHYHVCEECDGWGKLPGKTTGASSKKGRTDEGTYSLHASPTLNLVAQEEGQTVEFKETLIYNVHTNQADPDIFHSSLKTIAAFLNADGGTLLIGVSDAREIKGIDRDKRAMGNVNNDRFELKIRDAISGQNSRFTPGATGNVQISFQELSEGTICRIDVQPLSSPEVQHFDNEVHVRDGNRTIKLTGPDLTNWITRRNQI